MSPATILPCHFSISRGHKLSSIQTLPFSEKYPRFCCTFLPLCSFQSSFQLEPQFQQQQQDDDDEDEHVIGDCVVFEEGIFEEDSYPETALKTNKRRPNLRISKSKAKAQDLIPEKWKGVLAEVTMSKKERREISQDMEFGSRIQKKKTPPLNFVCEEEYSAYRKTKMAQLTPVVLDNPTFPEENKIDVKDMDGLANEPEGKRVSPRNPRRAVYGGSLDDITEFFNSPKYERGRRVSTESAGRQRRNLFTTDETFSLSRHKPDLVSSTSGKWLPLHTLAASGEFPILRSLLKHDVDINGVDKDGFTALQRAIVANKQAITNYLLRESANPFLCDNDSASLMHYAVRTASIPVIKVLLLYNVNINLQDNDGWTPLHVAVQTRRIDIVRLLLIKGANTKLQNKDGLTPLELCLYSGRNPITYQLIKLLKQVPKQAENLYNKPRPLILQLPENARKELGGPGWE